MEDKRARFVSRSPGVGGAMASPSTGTGSGGRSQWRGMDLHTTTPSSHRRAMYISPVPLQAYANANAANANAANANTANTANASATNIHSHSHSAASMPAAAGASGEAMRMRSEAAALSARNQVLHRRLSERKRFDSADYAMKLVRQAMQGDAKDAPAPASSPSPATGGSAMAALQSPRLSPTHGRMVFAHALKDGRASGDADVEMKDVSNQEMHAAPAQPAVAPARGYGALQSSGAKTASAVMSARNIMIQRKLQEKRHFDSADYQLARLGVATDVNMEDVGEPALEPAALTLNISADASSPVNSPSAARAAITRSNQMSPSVRASSGATGFGGRADAGKYGGLGGGRAQAAKPQNDLRRNTLLRQQENFIAAQNPASASSPQQQQQQQQQQQPSPMSTPAGKQQPYGKLMAANILFRKNLKDRQRFDSADYQMEAAAKQAERAGRSATDTPDNNAVTQLPNATISTSNQDDEPSSPVMKPQAKHIKLSEDTPLGGRVANPTGAPTQVAGRGGWAAHAGVAAARQSQSQAREDGVRVAARNVLLSRKLSEGKKLFDSGEYFAAKDKAARAGSSRGHMQR